MESARSKRIETMLKTPNLPPEIIEDVLCRLPVKPLLRFRCISKFWHAILSTDSTFIQKHLTRTFQDDGNHGFIFRNIHAKDVVEGSGDLLLVGSSNGLVCLDEHLEGDPDAVIYLWNPATRECRQLPQPTSQFFSQSIQLDRHKLGFSYEPLTNEYKVVRLVNFACHLEVEVYCLGTNCWRIIGSFPYFVLDKPSRAVMNGVFHWIAYDKAPSHTFGFCIISFDLADETFGELPMPYDIHQSHMEDLYLRTFNGSLFMFTFDDLGWTMWAMKEYGVKESWTKLFTIENLEGRFAKPIEFFKNGEFLLDVYNSYSDLYNLASWNVESRKMKELEFLVGRGMDAVCYVESLVPLTEAHGEVNNQKPKGLNILEVWNGGDKESGSK